MKCAWPGCENEKQQSKTAVWCVEHKRTMASKGKNRAIGKAARKAVRAHEHRVGGNGVMVPGEAEYVPTVHCKVCCGMPWARQPDRCNPDPGGWTDISVTTVAAPYTCRECGEPYAPEPMPKLCGTIRSSAGSAVAHGELHGIAWEFRGRRSDGKRKGVSK